MEGGTPSPTGGSRPLKVRVAARPEPCVYLRPRAPLAPPPFDTNPLGLATPFSESSVHEDLRVRPDRDDLHQGFVELFVLLGHDEQARPALRHPFGTKPLVDELLKESAQRRVMGKQGVKAAPVHGEKIHGGRAAGGGHPWVVAHERHLAEALPRTESRQDFLDVPRALLDHLHLPVDDDIETVAAVPLTEYDLLRLEMLPAEAWRLLRLELDDVGRKQQVQEPIRRHPHLAVEPRHLHQVDRAPQQPGEEARELDPEHFGDGRPVPESGELAERLERERPFGFAPQGRDEIPRHAPGLSDPVLSRRRTRLPGLAYDDPLAVAERPYSWI